MQNKKKLWSNNVYKELPPVGFIIRDEYPDRWLRIHSLKNAKRYPDNISEEKDLISRYIKSAKHVLGDNKLMLFISFYNDNSNYKLKGPDWINNFNFKFISNIDISENGEDPYYLITYGTSFLWSESIFKKIMMDVVNENIGPIVFFSEITKGIFAPYDGGADLFYYHQSKKIEAKILFKDWISRRNDGL